MRKKFDKFCFMGLPVLMIGTFDKNGKPNCMNAAWGVQSDFDEITIFLSEHKTTDNLKETGAFTVSYATADNVAISDYFGIESGHDVDKIAVSGVKVTKSGVVNAPLFDIYPVTLECKVRNLVEEKGGYTLIGEVVSMSVDENVITDENIDTDKVKPIVYDSTTDNYRVIAGVVGKAFEDGIKIKK